MKQTEPLIGTAELVRLILGTIALLITGYVRFGERVFQLGFMDSPFLSIGIAGSLVYIIFMKWGWRNAGAASVLLSIINAALAQRSYVTVWSETWGMLLMIVLLCHCLSVWKIEKPVIGRLLLLGPLFAFVGWVLTLGLRFFYDRADMLQAPKNNAVHDFILGVGLAIGLELAELIIRYLRNRSPRTSSP